VVGLGYIAQVAVLPSFRHAAQNSKLVALFSDDSRKRRELAQKYRVPIAGSYQEYDTILQRGEIDAVYIATPNTLHRTFAVRAAQAGVHVLCEKPLATTEADCRKILEACQRHRVKLMTAYRLHFEKSNLEAVSIVQSGDIGNPRYFDSIFSMQVSEPNIRLDKKMGGGALYDIGIYCINAARYLFRDEPIEVLCMTAAGSDKRFREVEETAAAIMRFPGERLASFVCSFGAADTATYHVTGTKGILGLKDAYEYASPPEMQLTINGRNQVRKFGRRDQFGPELVYFSNCILCNREPEPSGMEGLNDVRIIEALYRSARTSKPVQLAKQTKRKRPSLRQEIRRPAVEEPKLIHVKPASR
jgi:glucose-fructose oxidoreductase